MRILVLGAGVIGSVYAGKLHASGQQVVMLARGARLVDLRRYGLLLHDAESDRRTVEHVTVVGELAPDDHFDVVLVCVRCEQLSSTLSLVAMMNDSPPVLFFGNTAGAHGDLVAALGDRALFGFPAVGGFRDGAVIRFVLITEQKTMLGEPGGAMTARVRSLQGVLAAAGFRTATSANMEDWLMAHTAFIVPIAFALYRLDVDPAALAADHSALQQMVRATRQAFRALNAAGNTEIPTNLRILYLWVPMPFVVRYWRRVLAGPRGELWFGAHTRAAPEEMRALSTQLHAAVRCTGRPAPDLDSLLA